MNERQKTQLKKHRVQIVNDLEPRGTVLDCLCEDDVLTENDAEEISSARTRKERCQALLRLIQRRGPSAYGSFTRALARSSLNHIAEQLDIPEDEKYFENRNPSESEMSFNRNSDQLSRCNALWDDLNENGATEKINPINKCMCSSKRNQFEDQNSLFSESHRYASTETINPTNKDLHHSTWKHFEGHVSLIVDNVEPRDLFDVLIQDGVLTEDEMEDIESLRTRRNKCEKLVQILLRKTGTGSDVIGTLMNALARKYQFIVDTIINSKTQNKSRTERYYCSSGSKPVKPEHDIDNVTNVIPKLDNVTLHAPIPDFGGQTDSNHNHILTGHREKSVESEPDASDILSRNTDSSHHSVSTSDLVTYKPVTAIPSQGRGKQLGLAFDYLSTLVNQGDFIKFDSTTHNLMLRFSQNHDLMCIIGYLKACKDLFQADFDAATKHVKSTMELVPKTSNPRYFTLELLAAKIRMYIIQKKLGKLKTTQDDAMMLMETDPGGCSGRAAGWLCINDARTMTAQMSCLNLSKPNAMQAYNKLFLRAKRSLQRSMTNFKNDGGKDGPFGFGFALTRMVVLLMRCGDNGNTMDILVPSADDVLTAGKYIHYFEDSDIELSKILQMHFGLAKCDYQFRRDNLKRATEHAQSAFELATEMNILEFKEHACNRLNFLKGKLSVIYPKQNIEEEFHEAFLVSNSGESFDGETTGS